MTSFSATLQFNFVTVERFSQFAKRNIANDSIVLIIKINIEEIPLKV